MSRSVNADPVIRRARLVVLLSAVVLFGCGAKPIEPERGTAEPVFNAESFFLGRTRGDGSLKIRLRAAQRIQVEGRGRIDPDGTLVLDQIVTRGARPPQKRQWRIRADGPGRYTGTLTDAVGGIEGAVRGNLLHLSYEMKGGVRAQQWIYLQPDGRTAINRMAITKFGMTVARLDETIRKLD